MAFVKGDCSRRGLWEGVVEIEGLKRGVGVGVGVARRPIWIWEWESEECGGAN
jgi:hypothetical protein